MEIVVSDQSVMDNIPASQRKDQTRLFALTSPITHNTKESIPRFHSRVSPDLHRYFYLMNKWKISVEIGASSVAEVEGHWWFSVTGENVEKPQEIIVKLNLIHYCSEDVTIAQTSAQRSQPTSQNSLTTA